jgi:hypothetical protein
MFGTERETTERQYRATAIHHAKCATQYRAIAETMKAGKLKDKCLANAASADKAAQAAIESAEYYAIPR